MSALPTSMPAAVYLGAGQLAVEERPVPAPGTGQALIEVSHCGVCGTDLHMVLDGWGKPGSVGGHEYAGRIAAVGEGVDGWHVGEAVVGGPTEACGRCGPCLDERPSLCLGRHAPGAVEDDGAFAAYVRVEESQLLRVPDGLSLREAALAEPLAVALHAITRSGVRPGQRALVCGAGPIGALVVAALRASGVDDVVVSEPSPSRRLLAERVGATQVLEPEALERPSPFEPATVVADAVDVAFECSGKGVAMAAALGQLHRGGTLVLVGAGMDQPNFDANRILLNELIVTGAYEYDQGGMSDALELLAEGRLPTAELVERDDVPLSDMLDAMRRLAGGDLAGKVLVVPRG